MQALLEQLWELMPCDGISVMWLDGEHLEVMASRGSTAPLRGLNLPVSQVGAARAAMDGGRPVAVADTAEDAVWQPVPGEGRVRSWLGVPLRADNWTLGLLEWTSLEPSRFGEADVMMAGEVARCVAPILHRAQLLEDARAAAARAHGAAFASGLADDEPERGAETGGARGARIHQGPARLCFCAGGRKPWVALCGRFWRAAAAHPGCHAPR